MIEIDWEKYYTLEESRAKLSKEIIETAYSYFPEEIRKTKMDLHINNEICIK